MPHNPLNSPPPPIEKSLDIEEGNERKERLVRVANEVLAYAGSTNYLSTRRMSENGEWDQIYKGQHDGELSDEEIVLRLIDASGSELSQDIAELANIKSFTEARLARISKEEVIRTRKEILEVANDIRKHFDLPRVGDAFQWNYVERDVGAPSLLGTKRRSGGAYNHSLSSQIRLAMYIVMSGRGRESENLPPEKREEALKLALTALGA